MIVKICGGEVSKLDVQSIKKIKIKKILFDLFVSKKLLVYK